MRETFTDMPSGASNRLVTEKRKKKNLATETPNQYRYFSLFEGRWSVGTRFAASASLRL